MFWLAKLLEINSILSSYFLSKSKKLLELKKEF